MTHEYLRAIETYRLSYPDVKRMARQGLEHAFLPGESLWTNTKLVFRTAPPCASDVLGGDQPSAVCASFLSTNEKAREQWRLETEFAGFEKKY
jgi:hypothetical protein